MVLPIVLFSVLGLSGQCQALRLLLAANGRVLRRDPLEGAQMLLGGMCNSGAGIRSGSQRLWVHRKQSIVTNYFGRTCQVIAHRLAGRLTRMLLRNAVVSLEVPALGCFDGGTVLQFVAQLRVEAVLIGHVLNGAHLVLRIHIGERAPNDAGTIGYLSVLAIHMAWSTPSLVAEHIRAGRNLGLRGDQMGNIRPGGAEQANDLESQTGRVTVE